MVNSLVPRGSTRCSWGGVSFPIERVLTPTANQVLSGIRTGPEIDRIAQQGLMKVKFSDWSGGLDSTPMIKSWTRDLGLLYYNQGLQVRLPGLCELPYVLTTQAAVVAVDISSLAATPQGRVHSILSGLGTTGMRFYAGVSTRLLRDVSLTNPALESGATFTNKVTSIAEMVVNGTSELWVATDGATDDIKGTTDPTGSPPTWTTRVPLSSGDYVDMMAYLPTVGPGLNVLRGKIGGVNAFWAFRANADFHNVWPAYDSKAGVSSLLNTVIVTNGTRLSGIYGLPASGADDSASGSQAWTTPSGITASAGAAATAVVGSGATTHYLVASLFGFSDVPANAIITGISFTVVDPTNISTVQSFISEARLTLSGSAIGNTISGNPIPAGATSFILGGDAWGVNLYGSDLANLGFRLQINCPGGSNLSIDYIQMAVAYRTPFNVPSLPLAGFAIRPSSTTPERTVLIAPRLSDTAAVTQPRRMWYVDWEYTGSVDLAGFTLSSPNIGLENVHHACAFQGGYAVTGGSVSGPGTSLKHVDSSGNLRDFAFPGAHGTTPVKINNLFAQGTWLIMDVLSYGGDGTVNDRQWWLWNAGKFYPDTLLQSLSGTSIAKQPIPYAEAVVSLQQNRVYSVYPASTNIGAVRQFLPSDLNQDPRAVNTAEVRADGPVYAITTELDVGPEEASKSLTVVSHHGRLVTTQNSTYGSVTLDVNVNGSPDFSSPAVSHEFTTPFEEYDYPGGIQFRTLMMRVGLKHEASSAKSPNGLSWLLTTAQQWIDMDKYDLEVNLSKMLPNYWAFVSRMYTIKNTKAVQTLHIGSRKVLAVFDGISITGAPHAPSLGAPPSGASVGGNDVHGILHFRQVPGTTA